MRNTMQQGQPEQKQQNQALKFIITQFVVTVVLSAALLLVEYHVAYSALVGGLIATLANAWFAFKVFRVRPVANRSGEQSDEQPEKAASALLATFYVGEVYRFVFTGAMFIIAFKLIKPISAVALLATYFLIHLTPAAVNLFVRDDMKHGVSSLKDKEN